MKPVRTPVRLQLDSTECGAACLGIVLEYLGSFVSAAELRDRCQVSRAGSNAAALVSAAEQFGLRGKGLRVDLHQLDSISLPAIIHWRMNHFVVLEGLSASAAWINDPAQGRRKISLTELAENFTGIALTFTPLETYRPTGTKPGLLRGLLSHCRFYRQVITYCLLAAALSVFPTVAFAVGSQVFIDKAIVAGDTYFARPVTWVLLTLAVVQALVVWLRLATLNDLRVYLANGLSQVFLTKLFDQNILYFSKRFPAEIASRISLSTGIAHAISHELVESMCGILTAILILAALVTIHPALAGVVTIMLMAVCALMLAAGGKRDGLSQQLAHSEGKLQATAIESLSSVEAIKGGGLERFAFNRWHHFLRQATQLRVDLQKSTIQLSSWTGLILSLTSTSVIGGGGLMVVSGRMTLGSLVAFQILLPFLLSPMIEVVRLVGRLQFVSADLLRFTDVTESEAGPIDQIRQGTTASNRLSKTNETVKDAELSEGLIASNATNSESTRDPLFRISGDAIGCKDLIFSYGHEKQACLNRLSFSVPVGQWLGVTGPSGCGKSTLARLLARLYKPQEGSIRIHGVDSQTIETATWHSLVGYADQNTSLVPGTLRQHLQGLHPCDDAAMLHALDLVGLKDTISRLRHGLGSCLDENSLSGGELQRMELARLMLSPARILILDELTSNLDAVTEARVLQALKEKRSTIVFVSHRPSVLQNCEQVLYLKDGQPARVDSHRNLIRFDCGYAKLLGTAQ